MGKAYTPAGNPLKTAPFTSSHNRFIISPSAQRCQVPWTLTGFPSLRPVLCTFPPHLPRPSGTPSRLLRL